MAQKYVAQPKENGKYEVARFNEITRQYELELEIHFSGGFGFFYPFLRKSR